MRYQAFVQKADEEGYPGAAILFRAAARAEIVHALNHLKARGSVKGTKENIGTAVDNPSSCFPGPSPRSRPFRTVAQFMRVGEMMSMRMTLACRDGRNTRLCTHILYSVERKNP